MPTVAESFEPPESWELLVEPSAVVAPPSAPEGAFEVDVLDDDEHITRPSGNVTTQTLQRDEVGMLQS
jgi:hypothetical protein